MEFFFLALANQVSLQEQKSVTKQQQSAPLKGYNHWQFEVSRLCLCGETEPEEHPDPNLLHLTKRVT